MEGGGKLKIKECFHLFFHSWQHEFVSSSLYSGNKKNCYAEFCWGFSHLSQTPDSLARPSGPQTSHFIHLTDFLSFFLYADFSSPVLVESVGSGRTFPVKTEGPNMSCPFTSEGATNVDFATLHFQIINHLQHSHLLCHSIFSCLFSLSFYQLPHAVPYHSVWDWYNVYLVFWKQSLMLSDAAFTVFIQKFLLLYICNFEWLFSIWIYLNM